MVDRSAPRCPRSRAFHDIVAAALSRRAFMRGSAALGAGAILPAGAALAPRPSRAADTRLMFPAVAANTRDTVTVPDGFNWHVVASWGDPLWSHAPAFDPETRGTAASQALAIGDNNDGMEMFAGGGRSVLAVNNEYVNLEIMFGNRASERPESEDDVRKNMAAHGVSIFEVTGTGGRWRIAPDSPVNRRITADTPMTIAGPARGHPLLRTAADPDGTRARGTWNNCGCGRTPWGTYLACEENFNGYFSASDPGFTPDADQTRYGIGAKDWGHGWARVDSRFDVSRHPNEPNRVGYVVEIDPLNPAAAPRKRTALGRFKHENAEVELTASGHVVVYMGDDERGEFLYRFVSADTYRENGATGSLLDSGTLYAARFHDNMRGEWVALTPENTGLASQAEICIRTRQAASAVGATTMDRPEWVAANPARAEVFCCLTNNKNRGIKPNAGGDPAPVNGPNPRARNRYGQIVRWAPDGGDHAAPGFTWDLFAVAGNPTVHADAYAGSANIDAGNMFNAPDGLAFDRNGLMWIQTDGNTRNRGEFAGMGNNQMLAGDPETGEIRRFLAGPRGAEVTGLTWSEDRRTLFVGIQHPGAKDTSHFPGGGNSLPRSSIIAIARDDGEAIG